MLLGTAAEFQDDVRGEGIKGTILGWVPKSRVCMWETREAVEYAYETTWKIKGKGPMRTEPAQVYETPEYAKKAFEYYRQGRRGEKVKFLSIETFQGGKSVKWSHDRMRYPVFAMSSEEKKVLAQIKGNECLKIGVIGEFVNEKGENVQFKVKRAEIEKQIEALEKESSVLQILFVIDNTTSMNVWFKEVAETVKSIINDVNKQKNIPVELGLVFYNDREAFPNEPNKVVEVVCPLAPANSKQVEKISEELEKRCDEQGPGGGAPREDVFLGIQRAIDEAGKGFNISGAGKVVIVIGDKGDKVAPTQANNPENAHTTDAGKSVLKRLVRSKPQTPIELYALHVESSKASPDAALFEAQMQSLIGQLRDDTDRGEDFGGYISATAKGELSSKILKRYENLRKKIVNLKREFMEAKAGMLKKVGPTRMSKDFQDTLRSKPGVEEYFRLKGFDVFHYGYIWEKPLDGTGKLEVKQIRPKILMKKAKMEKLLAFLQQIKGGPTQDFNLQTVAKRLVKEQLGEEDGSISDVAKKKFGLTFRSNLLTTPWKDLPRPALYRKEMLRINLAIMKFEDAIKEKKYQYELAPVKDSAVKRYFWKRLELINGKPAFEKRPRFFYIGGDKSRPWCWVDLETELP